MTKHYTPADFIRSRDYVANHGGAIFPTQSSFEWFMRTHRDELIASGEVIIKKGTGGTSVGPGFGELAVEIMQREQVNVA